MNEERNQDLPLLDLEKLAAFHGTPEHEALLNSIRRDIVAHMAAILLEEDWGRTERNHTRARHLIELLVEYRLDKIDIRVLAQSVVSQFESTLPDRVQVNKDYQASQESDL